MPIFHKFRTGKRNETKEAQLNPIKAIVAHCIECMGGNSREVSECTGELCALYPFREGVAHSTRSRKSSQNIKKGNEIKRPEQLQEKPVRKRGRPPKQR